MATKQNDKEVKTENKEEKKIDVTKPRVEKEPKTSFDERTQDVQPWAGTEGVDSTRPEPQVVN